MAIKNNTEISQVMKDALFQLQHLVIQNQSAQPEFLGIIKTFLLGVISTAIDLVEVNLPGSTPLLYADLEAAMKMGGLREIVNVSSNHGTVNYSVSNLDEHDMAGGMNYIGQQLSITLFKSLHELPLPLRNQEMMLRSVEVLLANLLNQKFSGNAHQILDSLCEHVHMALTDLEQIKNH